MFCLTEALKVVNVEIHRWSFLVFFSHCQYQVEFKRNKGMLTIIMMGGLFFLGPSFPEVCKSNTVFTWRDSLLYFLQQTSQDSIYKVIGQITPYAMSQVYHIDNMEAQLPILFKKVLFQHLLPLTALMLQSQKQSSKYTNQNQVYYIKTKYIIPSQN